MRLGFGGVHNRLTLTFVGLFLIVQLATLSLAHYLGARPGGAQDASALGRAERAVDQGFARSERGLARAVGTLAHSTIELWHSRGMTVTAEGVESAEQAALLRSFGCDGAQGHFNLPAVPVAQFDAWMRRRHPAGVDLPSEALA